MPQGVEELLEAGFEISQQPLIDFLSEQSVKNATSRPGEKEHWNKTARGAVHTSRVLSAIEFDRNIDVLPIEEVAGAFASTLTEHMLRLLPSVRKPNL